MAWWLLPPAIAIGSASAAYAALLSQTGNSGNSASSGTVALADNDGGSTMLSLANAALGATDTGCIRTTYSGSLGSNVRHYAPVTGALAPYLSLKVTRGSGAGTFDSCAGFTPDGEDYIGAGPGVLFDGKLSNYPTTYGTGIVDPADGGSGSYAATVSATAGLVNYYRFGDPATVYSSDTFTGSAGTALESHTGEVGATWTKFGGTSTAVLSDADRLRRNTATPSQYYTSVTPSSADYAVEADVVVKSLIFEDAVNVVGRQDISNASGTYYAARYLSGNWELNRIVGGVITNLDSAAASLTPGQTYRLKLKLQGTALSLYVNGALTASATDASISAAGRPGVRLGTTNNPASPTNTTGLHLDNFRVTPLTQTAADSKGTNDGAYVNGVDPTATGALPGDPNKSARFDGVDDYVTLARQVSDDVSIEFWLKSTQGRNTNNQWWGNAGLVDADNAGQANDFGVSLRSDGKLVAGVGNPDTSIVSSLGGYNDGNWHHVLFTRRKSTGALNLFIDGVSAASGTATNTASLTGAANINIGRIQSGGNYFAGDIDEVALYSAALTATEANGHYASTRVAEAWTTSETHDYRFEVTVDNDSSANGLSSTATFTWEARNT